MARWTLANRYIASCWRTVLLSIVWSPPQVWSGISWSWVSVVDFSSASSWFLRLLGFHHLLKSTYLGSRDSVRNPSATNQGEGNYIGKYLPSLFSDSLLILLPWPVRLNPVDSSDRFELRNIFNTSESSRLSSFFSTGGAGLLNSQ